jgi:hypothetical protein
LKAGAKRDPRFGAAVLKVAFLEGGKAARGYLEVYEGTLRDLGLGDAEVDAYIREHRREIEEACARMNKPERTPGKGG